MSQEGNNSEWEWLPEWYPHEATWLSWPHNQETWPRNLSKAQDEFEALIRCLAEREEVRLLVGGEQLEQVSSRGLDEIKNVSIWPFPTNDAWVRDYGPTVVHRRKVESHQEPPQRSDQVSSASRREDVRFIDWQYNAWGNKYPPFDNDQRIARHCADYYGCASLTQSIVLEGGAIEGNGNGLLLTTESCLREANRNPQLSCEALDHILQDILGVETVIWLPGGDIVGDDTDGHIDQIARCINESTFLISTERDSNDENYATFQENRAVLQRELETRQVSSNIVEIPLPGAVEMFGVRLPASYANFIWTNDAIIVPQFLDPNDEQAMGIFRDLLPEREVIGMPCRELVVGLGAWHCLSQQHCHRPLST